MEERDEGFNRHQNQLQQQLGLNDGHGGDGYGNRGISATDGVLREEPALGNILLTAINQIDTNRMNRQAERLLRGREAEEEQEEEDVNRVRTRRSHRGRSQS